MSSKLNRDNFIYIYLDIDKDKYILHLYIDKIKLIYFYLDNIIDKIHFYYTRIIKFTSLNTCS